MRAKSRVIEPTIWVGKEGLTQQLIQHVQNQLKARELVKVKLQRSALTDSETESVAEKTSGATESILVDVMGHTFTLYKKKSESGTTTRHESTR